MSRAAYGAILMFGFCRSYFGSVPSGVRNHRLTVFRLYPVFLEISDSDMPSR